MITFSKTANSVEMNLGTDIHYLRPDMAISAKVSSGKIYLSESPSTSTTFISFLPTEVNGRPGDDILVVAEWLRDTYFIGLSLSGTAGGGPIEDGALGTIKASVFDYTSSNPLAVRLTDTNGDYISAAGSTQYTEGDIDASITGSAILAEVTATSTVRTLQTKLLNSQLNAADYGIITNTVIHGQTTAGGGAFVDVKVNPSGALSTETNLESYTANTVSNVSASATVVTILAINASRKMASFYNDSSSACYLKLGSAASTTSFTVKMAAASFYELPIPIYTGIITGIWDSATGTLRITESA